MQVKSLRFMEAMTFKVSKNKIEYFCIDVDVMLQGQPFYLKWGRGTGLRADGGEGGRAVFVSVCQAPEGLCRSRVHFYSASTRYCPEARCNPNKKLSTRLRALNSEQNKRKLSELQFQFALVPSIL